MFRIEFGPMEWINGPEDDPEDLCSHGDVTIILDDVRISDSCCTSAAAMRMLRSLTEDHEMKDRREGEQMLPCCGHELFAGEDGQRVTILSCPFGKDFGVRHEGENVLITTEEGRQFTVSTAEYSREIIKFAGAVESFYRSSAPKVMPCEQYEVDGYMAFWNEWNRRRDTLKNFYFPENNA